jgi:hypothetical protein
MTCAFPVAACAARQCLKPLDELRKIWFVLQHGTTMDCLYISFYQKAREPLVLAARQRGAHIRLAYAILAALVG